MKKKKERERRFIKRTLNRMNKDVAEKGYSPLIESLITIADSPWVDLTTGKNQKSLIFISDLLEKSDDYDFYKKNYWKKNPPQDHAKKFQKIDF